MSKSTNEVRHKDIRNLQVSQSIFQRLFGVGTLEIASAGHGGVEIKISGIPKPQELADIIRRAQDEG